MNSTWLVVAPRRIPKGHVFKEIVLRAQNTLTSEIQQSILKWGDVCDHLNEHGNLHFEIFEKDTHMSSKHLRGKQLRP